MSENSGRNFCINVIVLGASGVAAKVLGNVPMADIRDVLSSLWPVQGLLVGAILTLVYRLSSDTTSVATLHSQQRVLLDRMVTKKMARLWVLATLVVIPAVLARTSDRFIGAHTEEILLYVAMTFAISSALLCVYLPFMWNELRRFVTELVVMKERQDRVRADLDELRSKNG